MGAAEKSQGTNEQRRNGNEEIDLLLSIDAKLSAILNILVESSW